MKNVITKNPVTLMAILFALVVATAFMMIPSGADLISAQGDYYLGQAVGMFLVLAIIIDWYRRHGKLK